MMAWAGIDALSYNVTLDGTIVGDVASFEDAQAFKYSPIQLSTQHGGIGLLHRKGQNLIRVNGEIWAASLEALRDYLVSLDDVFGDDVSILVTTPDDRVKIGRVVSRRFHRAPPHRRVPYSLEIEVSEPFWLHPETYDIQTAPDRVPWNFTVVNGGSEPVRVVVEVTAIGAARGNMTLVNTTTGTLWQYGGSISQDKRLVVDGIDLKVLANNRNGLGDFSHAPFELEPGDNLLRYEGDVPVQIGVTWRQRYGG